MNNNKSQFGFSLLEILVALGIFSVVAISTTMIFQKVTESQRLAIAAQNTQESLRYTMEHISKEIRMAQEDDGACTSAPGTVFESQTGNTELYFKNQDGKCVVYKETNGAFEITRGGNPAAVITPNDINVSNLNFYIKSADQPAVTIIMQVNNIRFGGADLYKSQMDIQTTISSRYYEL